MRFEIKLCGMTNLPDARAALECGADYIGFVMYSRSPRAVTPAQVREIVLQLPAAAKAIGVFVNTARDSVLRVARDCGLYAVQIHGDEAPQEWADVPVRVWRAVRLDGSAPLPAPGRWPAERYILDAAPEAQYGGSGIRGDWSASAGFAARYPTMLAGGLTPENVIEAVRTVRPMGVDVSSGIESAPGAKDPDKMARFVESARQGAQELEA